MPSLLAFCAQKEKEKKKSRRTGRFFTVRTACYVQYSPIQKHKVRDRSTTVYRH